VIDIQQIYPYCKPMEEAFQIAIKTAGVENPADCVMIDDSVRNLRAAHDLGLFTIQVGTEERTDFVDAAILTIHSLPEVIPVDPIRRTGA
jgi:FMN phosphatase YigB (HAD superfamily)